jgi:hypothetical protein
MPLIQNTHDKRVALQVKAKSLMTIIRQLKSENIQIEHLYDY